MVGVCIYLYENRTVEMVEIILSFGDFLEGAVLFFVVLGLNSGPHI
jgi:hypothetical protein